jgi:NAD(P)-dependent dehydrogenase (short-subunit alcohol dehydrogenase family)
MSQAYKGKTALVTGAAKGIGAAVAQAFARGGGAVVCFDADDDALRATVERIAAAGGRAIVAHGDVRRADDTRTAVQRCREHFGGLDLLVNAAGVMHRAKLPDLTEEDWDFVLDINLKGVFQTCRYAIPELIARGGGVIVNVASVQAYWSHAGAVPYSASKAGVVGFTRALSVDHARDNIRAVAIAPGSVRTPMLIEAAEAAAPDNPQRALDDWAAAHPIGRVIEPSEIASIVLFLAGSDAAAVTGATLLVDGGILAGPAEW